MVRKYSKKREAVLAALQARRDNPTVEMLYQELKPRFPELSLGTVYRNLAILVEEKQAVNIGSFRGQERYDGRLDPHSHFVCRSCGRIEDLDVPDTVSTIFHQIESASGAQPESYALTITGVCAACRGKEKLARASAREAINGSNVKWNTNEEDTVMKKWVCQVCGHVHEGAAPPQLCPVCKVTSSHYAEAGQPPVEDMFSKDLETEQLAKIIEGEESAEPVAVKKWVCQVCGHVHEGAAPPELCPVCKVTSVHFAEAGQPPVEDMFSKDLETERLAKIIEGEESGKTGPVRKWVCRVCGHVHEGVTPPELCPVCKVTASNFDAAE